MLSTCAPCVAHLGTVSRSIVSNNEAILNRHPVTSTYTEKSRI